MASPNRIAVETFRTHDDVRMFGITPDSLKDGYASRYWNSKKALWRGILSVNSITDLDCDDDHPQCEIRLLDKKTNEIFAIAPYTLGDTDCIPCPDSRRSYAITFVNGSNSILVGITFLSGMDVDDFHVALGDFRRIVASQHVPAPAASDFSLAKGQSFHINLKKQDSDSQTDEDTQPATTTTTTTTTLVPTIAPPTIAPPPLLPPPPPAASSSTFPEKADEEDDDDEFGDFVS